MPSIRPLATLDPTCNARTWHSTPHPHLPILATSCSDKTVRIYSLQNFRQQSVISGGHKRSIRSSAWKPNSVGESVLATGSFDASAGIWRRWEEGGGKAGHGAAAAAAAEETDFTGGLAGGGEDEDEDEEWKFAVILDGHDSEIKSLAFSTTSPLLATCSRDKSVWIWEELEEDNFETVAVLQEHEGDVKCVAWHPSEEMLASGSYDDSVRLWREDVDDWASCALLTGHGGTVWWVEFEGSEGSQTLKSKDGISDEEQSLLDLRQKAGPRLVSCSDDLTIRIWRRISKDRPSAPTGQGRMPSIWKNRDFEEEWTEEAQLPPIHEQPIYAVSWSKKTGRIASTGSDGKIVVYEEQWHPVNSEAAQSNGDTIMTDNAAETEGQSEPRLESNSSPAKWAVVAEISNAHDVFEINNVVWAPRADREKKFSDEEVLVTTGDDGEVKVWTLET